MRLLALPIACCILVGCSASERIALEANNIGDRAINIERRATRIGERASDAETSADAAVIVTEAIAIRNSVGEIHAQIPGVVDRVPAWMVLLKWVAIAVAGAAAAWILTASGATTAIRVAVGWLPRRKVAEAEMTAATLASDKPETLREWIAMKRSSDAEFDAAWRRVNATAVAGRADA